MNQSSSEQLQKASARPVIALLTDFGLADGYVGVMKGVIVGIAPTIHIIDITHAIPPQNVPAGAWVLATSYSYFPKNTVFVCVVDPGVGSEREAIALHIGDWFFVGPNNGLFSYIYAEHMVHEAVALSNPAYHLGKVSSTFHGRDIFAPVGAHLASGVALRELGTVLDPRSLSRIDPGLPTQRGTSLEARILHIDHFGNLITNIPLSLVPDLFTDRKISIVFPPHMENTQPLAPIEKRQRCFADGPTNGEPFMYGDSSGHIGIAIRNGNAAQQLGVGYGALITLVDGTEAGDS